MPNPQTEAPLPRLHNPNLTDDEVRLLSCLLDLHVVKLADEPPPLITILVLVQQLASTQERGGGMPLAFRLKEKFDRLYELVGCNCGNPECSHHRPR